MGSRYSNDFDGINTNIGNDGGCLAMSDTPNQSPRILITRACSEESQDCESPLLKKSFSAATSDLQICESKTPKITYKLPKLPKNQCALCGLLLDIQFIFLPLQSA